MPEVEWEFIKMNEFLPLWLILMIAALISGFTRAAFGVGAGVLPVSIVSFFVEPAEAVGLLTPIVMLTSLTTLAAYWRQWDRSLIVPLGAGMIAGAGVGAWILASIPAHWFRIFLGLLAAGISLHHFLRRQPAHRPVQPIRPVLAAGVGVCAGIVSAVAHSGGLILAAYLLAAGLVKERFIATFGALLLLSDLGKIGYYLHWNIVTASGLQMSFAAVPAVFVGTWLGVQLNRRMEVQSFRFAVYAIIGILGILLLTT